MATVPLNRGNEVKEVPIDTMMDCAKFSTSEKLRRILMNSKRAGVLDALVENAHTTTPELDALSEKLMRAIDKSNVKENSSKNPDLRLMRRILFKIWQDVRTSEKTKYAICETIFPKPEQKPGLMTRLFSNLLRKEPQTTPQTHSI